MKRTLIIVGVVLLAAGIGAQLLPRGRTSTYQPSRISEIPIAGSNWSSRPLALGATENEKNAVSDTLKYDDVLYREYQSGGITFSLYVAYWQPGKMPTQLVSAHTPDYCWSAIGWQCTEMKHDVRLSVSGDTLQAGEERTFLTAKRERQHVLYWHLVGGKAYDYGNRFNAVPSPWRWWRDVVRQFFRPPPEQYFVRFASERPIPNLEQTPAFLSVLQSLAKIGLVQPSGAPAK